MFLFYLLLVIIVGSVQCSYEVCVPDDSEVEKPCAYDDQPCIKAEFIRRGWCEKAYEYPFRNEPILHVNTLNYTSPAFDVDITYHDAYVKGSQIGKIVALFTNKKNNFTVLSLQFENVEFEGLVSIRLYRKLKEDIVITTIMSERYPVIITTSGILPGDNVFSEIRTRATIPEIGKVEFGVGNVSEIQNEEVRRLFVRIYADLRTFVSDLFEDKAYEDRPHMFASAYVENQICEMKEKQ